MEKIIIYTILFDREAATASLLLNLLKLLNIKISKYNAQVIADYIFGNQDGNQPIIYLQRKLYRVPVQVLKIIAATNNPKKI